MIFEYVLEAEKSFIGAWFFEDLTICDDLIMHFEQNPNKVDGFVQRASEIVSTIDKNEKDSTDTILMLDTDIGQRYVNELQKVLDMYKIKFIRSDKVAAYTIEGVNIQKYNPHGGYKTWHAERSGALAPGGYRHLVFMTYLNDIEDKGETEFLYQKIKVKPKKGLTLIWPVDWTHTHRGIPSPTQTKYIATGWYSFTNRNFS